MWRLLALALLHLARTAADTSTAERIRSGQTSSFEEVSRRLARAFRHDDDVRAFVSIFGAEALREAAARDADTANGFSRGRLHGVPFAIKDLFALDGRDTRAGFATAVWEAERNATAVQTLLDEGAILLGTTRLTEGAWTEYASACLADGECPPRNPFGAELWQGDSSSGCGVGVAAGFFPFCLATDTSGSIRNPCLMNSLTCVKPRRNILSGDGVWPLSQRLDTVGVMARTAAEIGSVLGHDVDAAASGLRLGVDWALVAAAEPESVRPTLRDATALCEGLGVRVENITGKVVELIPLMDELGRGSRTTIARDVARNYAGLDLEMGGQLRELVDLNVTEAQAAAVEGVAAAFGDRWARAFGDLDAVLLPVWGRPAPLAEEIPAIVTTPALFAEAVRYMVPFNYADLPLVVVPAAVSRCRGGGACPYALRPRAFQLVGRNEATLLRLAAAYELERGELAFPLDPKSSDAGAATLLFGGALLTLTAVVAGAFFLVLV